MADREGDAVGSDPVGEEGDVAGGDGVPDAAFDEGRYLYCVVRTEGDDAVEEFAVDGIEDEPVYVVVDGDRGAVVHRCESLYDSDDLTTLKRWLLAHQRVVDAAAEAVGTPLPVRFDTVLTGDDDTVREWLRESADELDEALDSLAGRREYRIQVRRNEEALADRLAEQDERLGDLRDRRGAADEGTAFLVGKQYDERLSKLVRDHREREADALEERLSKHADEVRRLGRNRTASLLGSDGDDDDAGGTRFAVLASVDREDDIGSLLDEVAAEDGVEVRFSGPWPPYTFAPELGSVEEGAS